MTWLAVIWFVFATIFLTLGVFHWVMAGKGVSPFKISERPYDQIEGVTMIVKMKGSDIDQPLRDFVADFNSYIDHYNQTSSTQQKIQAIGSWVASATAIFSFILTIL